MKSFLQPEFQIVRDEDRCIHCEVCVRQCAFESHSYDSADGKVTTDSLRCVGCQRCATLCPTQALVVREHPREYRGNAYWTARTIEEIYKQAETGGLLLSSMGSDMPHTLYWDNLLLDASQVTNPSIDPLREPMELKTFLGRKPRAVKLSRHGRTAVLETALAPQLEIETPILFSAMSYGAISYNTCLALAGAARECGIFYNTGEGGLHRDLYRFGKNTIVQVASGRFGVHKDYLEAGAAIEIKIGQGAKPGIGGHLPGEKVDRAISETRMIPEGTEARSPAPHHDI